MKNVAEEDLTGLVWGTGSVAFAALAPFIGGGPGPLVRDPGTPAPSCSPGLPDDWLFGRLLGRPLRSVFRAFTKGLRPSSASKRALAAANREAAALNDWSYVVT